ncbi:MAG: AI-2E family transporter [Acidobacteria bacterium]|nr:AI-2E family transporter [Acidobacteriota bacterium]
MVPTVSPSIESKRHFTMNLIGGGVAIALLYFGRDFLVTCVTGITIAFILEPFVQLVMKLRLPRAVASFVVCAVALLSVYAAGLAFYAQVAVLMEDLPAYSARLSELSGQVVAKLEETEKTAQRLFAPPRAVMPSPKPNEAEAAHYRRRRSAEPPPSAVSEASVPAAVQEVRIRPDRTPLVQYVYSNWERLYHIGLLASFVPFLVYFMLSWAEHLRRAYLSLFQGPERHAAGRSLQGIADMARAYVVGNFLLGLILTGASGLFFWYIKLPYWPLVAPFSGFLSLVPYVGLPLSIVPPLVAALTIYSKLTAYVIIAAVVGFLHLLALNLLYPKLVGSRVHLNPLVVTVALMFWASLWGAIGLLFAIPVTAGVKAVVDTVPEWEAYGRLLGD